MIGKKTGPTDADDLASKAKTLRCSRPIVEEMVGLASSRNGFQRQLASFVSGAVALGVVACGGAAVNRNASECTIEELEVAVEAGPRLNPTEGGEPLPALARVLQLTTTAKLQAIDFDEVWSDAEAALEGEFLQQTELQLFPGETTTQRLPLAPNAQYLAMIGGFRELRERAWWTVTRLRPHLEQACAAGGDAPVLRVRVTADRFRIAFDEHAPAAAGAVPVKSKRSAPRLAESQ